MVTGVPYSCAEKKKKEKRREMVGSDADANSPTSKSERTAVSHWAALTTCLECRDLLKSLVGYSATRG